jgi:Rieske Fe-S protein
MSTHNGKLPSSQPEDLVTQPRRRKFMAIIVGLINLSLFGAIFGPIVGFIASPLKTKKAGQWVPVLGESELAPGQVREASFTMKIKDGYHTVDRKYTMYLRRGDDGVVCIDPACTHLGCRVLYQESNHRFVCPCHGGVFSADGKNISGPPPKPLETHPVKVEGGKIWVYKEA